MSSSAAADRGGPLVESTIPERRSFGRPRHVAHRPARRPQRCLAPHRLVTEHRWELLGRSPCGATPRRTPIVFRVRTTIQPGRAGKPTAQKRESTRGRQHTETGMRPKADTNRIANPCSPKRAAKKNSTSACTTPPVHGDNPARQAHAPAQHGLRRTVPFRRPSIERSEAKRSANAIERCVSSRLRAHSTGVGWTPV